MYVCSESLSVVVNSAWRAAVTGSQ